MESWKNLAKDSRTAAWEMFGQGRWRSCLSRAYFAVYSKVTEALIQQGVTMPVGYEGPSHIKLPGLIVSNLTGISLSVRWKLEGRIRRLYNLRITADYKLSLTVDEAGARIALGLVKEAFDCCGGKS